MDPKNAFMINQGFHLDTVGNMDPTNEANTMNTNVGFKTRCTWFREDFDLSNDWRADGFTMMGRLQHELMGVDKSTPPGKSGVNPMKSFLCRIGLSSKKLEEYCVSNQI